MYRKINRGRSITKILIYSAILTWFTVILIENWRRMRLSWFNEVWEFIDSKAIVHYIDEYLGISVVFGAGLFTLYQVIAMFVRAGRNEGVPSDHFEEPSDSSAEFLAEMRAKWEEDFITNPEYHHIPGNIWHQKRKQKDEDQ